MERIGMKRRSFDIGDLYVVPWQLTGAPKKEDFFENTTVIPDKSIVVVFGVEEGRLSYSSKFYWVKILTTNGLFLYVECTLAGLNYWKKVDKSMFSSKK